MTWYMYMYTCINHYFMSSIYKYIHVHGVTLISSLQSDSHVPFKILCHSTLVHVHTMYEVFTPMDQVLYTMYISIKNNVQVSCTCI